MLTDYELEKIKDSIVPSEKLISKSGEVFFLNDYICKNINCYAYALGIQEPFRWIYTPGFTVNEEYDYTKEDMLIKICEDLKNLNIQYRQFGVYDKILLDDDEYLIQVLYVPNNSNLWYKPTFHFSRKSKNKIWYSKQGWYYQPTIEKVRILEKKKDEEVVNTIEDTNTIKTNEIVNSIETTE